MKEILFCGSVIVGSLFVAICVWVFVSSMEASVYTELTGKKVTTYQAMWVDLRVVEPPREDL